MEGDWALWLPRINAKGCLIPLSSKALCGMLWYSCIHGLELMRERMHGHVQANAHLPNALISSSDKSKWLENLVREEEEEASA